MSIPKDFQFSDNPDVNKFAGSRMELLFGENWRVRGDLILSYPADSVEIADKGGWSLEVEKSEFRSLHYTVICKKDGRMEDPSPNIPARSCLNNSGTIYHISHCSKGASIDPPDGSPTQINYRENGDIRYWYCSPDNPDVPKPATEEEVASRVAIAKQTALAKLCDDSQEIVALKSGNPSTPALGVIRTCHPSSDIN